MFCCNFCSTYCSPHFPSWASILGDQILSLLICSFISTLRKWVCAQVHNLDADALALRKVETLDIGTNARDYWTYIVGGPEIDLTNFCSAKKQCGPLTQGWQVWSFSLIPHTWDLFLAILYHKMSVGAALFCYLNFWRTAGSGSLTFPESKEPLVPVTSKTLQNQWVSWRTQKEPLVLWLFHVFGALWLCTKTNSSNFLRTGG